MGIPRRFLNLIVSNQIPGVRSLCCIDLTRQQLFHPTTRTTTIGGGSESSTTQTPAADAGNPKNRLADAAASVMAEFRFPNPTFSFKAETTSNEWDINCFPVADRKVMCADQYGRAFLFDADARTVVTMPNLHKPKLRPFSLFVPRADAEADHGCGGSLYVMEGAPVPEGCRAQPSVQFEAFVYRKPTVTSESWQWHLLPPPPFVRDPTYHRPTCFNIKSYAVVDSGSRICISEEDTGTYCMDTVSHTWEHVGNWMLPFYGKVEYVPELKLWFGLSGKDQRLAAADLSAMGSQSQPQLVGDWQEFYPPKEWQESQEPQLVNLGSGRFCIVRFFERVMGWYTDYEIMENFVVFTVVEIMPHVHEGKCSDSDCGSGSENRKNKLGLTTFESRFQKNICAHIHAVF